MTEACCEGYEGRMIAWLGDGWCEWGKGRVIGQGGGQRSWGGRLKTKLVYVKGDGDVL